MENQRRYRTYLLVVLTIVYTFNFIDRQILSILAEPIKAELGLRDWHLGFLTGPAFALFYATLGIPVARLADRWHRVNVLSISLVIWSGLTAACGLATNFLQLALARVGVGVGEAGGSPPSISLISSYVPPRRRATAMAIYGLGVPIGTMFGFLIGGWVNEVLGWRWAFAIVGIPGVLLALVVKMTLREPAKEAIPTDDMVEDSTWRTFKRLWKIPVYRLTVLGVSIGQLTIYGFMIWVPVHLIRTFDVGTGEAGTIVGLTVGLAGGLGTGFGGWIADRLSQRNPRWLSLYPAVTQALFLVFMFLTLFTNNKTTFIVLLVPTYMLITSKAGAVWSVLQTAAPKEDRAMSAAIMLFLNSILGLGLGPLLVGVLSDIFQPLAGSDSVRYGLMTLSVFTITSVILYVHASKYCAALLSDSDKL